MRAPRKRPESLAWVEQTLGRGARVVATRPLTGGLMSQVHELTVVRNGRRSRYVLRSWTPDNEHKAWILRTVAAEAAVLTMLERSDVPAPRLVASTSDVAAGGPAVLMTRVPGRVFLMPRDREHWLRQITTTTTTAKDARRCSRALAGPNIQENGALQGRTISRAFGGSF